jgi:uncharacterized protein (DUF1778 family)
MNFLDQESVKTPPRIVVDVTPELREKIKVSAAATGQSVRKFVTKAIVAYMNQDDVKKSILAIVEDSEAA